MGLLSRNLPVLLQVPADHVGYAVRSLDLLKIMQGVITLSVLLPCASLYMRQPPKLDCVPAGVCMLGAVYFIFRH